MPRGVKGSGKATSKTTKKTPNTNTSAEIITTPVESEVSTKKSRKPYPSHEERIAMADKQIVRLSKLNEQRALLIEKTEVTLADRRDALTKSMAALEKAQIKKARIVAAWEKETQRKAPTPKLTKEERIARMAAGRAAKKAEKEKVAALLQALKASGKSVDELIAEIKPAE